MVSAEQKTVSQKTILKGLKYSWHVPEPDWSVVRDISLTHNIIQPVAHVLYSRGLVNHDAIRAFLFSAYDEQLHHPALLKDSLKAAERITQALDAKEKILIFGDYDVDGVTSSSLVLLGLIPLGANINFYLPNRVKDGYGLSSKIVKKAAENGYSLIITVDNGITAIEPARVAREHGIDLIITDHHRPHEHLPEAYAIVNPNQKDCPYPCKYLAGVGVAFKLISLIYEQKKLPIPDKVYELLMLGTIADVVPLVGENRFWVRHGLTTINRKRSIALSTLAHNGKLSKDLLNSLDIGFMIAPQINALGRLDDCREAVKFMISSDQDEVERIGSILLSLNEERKKVESGIYEQIESAILNQDIDLSSEHIILAANTSWPAGIIGLVAGKLTHAHGRPTILLHVDQKNGIAKGSCRSIPEFDIFNALTACSDLLISFGGHPGAAGLAIRCDNIATLKQRLEEMVSATISLDALQPKLTVEAYLELPDANKQLYDHLEKLEPFGNQNPQPLFCIKNVSLVKPPQLLKDKHVKCMLFAQGIIKPVIFFNRPDLYTLLANLGDIPFHLVGTITKNEWQGSTSIEIIGLDILISSSC